MFTNFIKYLEPNQASLFLNCWLNHQKAATDKDAKFVKRSAHLKFVFGRVSSNEQCFSQAYAPHRYLLPTNILYKVSTKGVNIPPTTPIQQYQGILVIFHQHSVYAMK